MGVPGVGGALVWPVEGLGWLEAWTCEGAEGKLEVVASAASALGPDAVGFRDSAVSDRVRDMVRNRVRDRVREG